MDNSDSAIDVALDTINRKKQALLFVNTKRSAEHVAEELASKLKPVKEMEKLAAEAENALSRPTKQCLRLGKCLRKAVAFHHSGLHQKQRELIERNFRESRVKIIACTPTLAAGVDLPAFRVIIRDLKRYGGHWGMTPIPVLEYHQMSGRAGRPGKEDYGEAITIASTKSQQNEIQQTYVRGKPEKIYSKLAVEPVLRTYVLSLVASNLLGSEKELQDFFAKTFWARQYEDPDKLNSIISQMIILLDEYGFITVSGKGDDFISANELSEKKIKATQIGKRVAELYLDPYTANHLITCLKKAQEDVENVNDFSFLQMISHTIEMMPLLRVRTREYDIINEKLAEYEENLLEEEPSLYDVNYDEFHSSIKTALFFMEWISEKDEEFLLENYNIRPGETRYKIDKAEWLFYACSEFAKILGMKELISLLRKTEVRVKYGVKEELLPLLKLSQIGRVRARKLYNAQIKTLRDVKKADLATLAFLIGKKTAESIKKQVNREEKPVKKGKRKGQLSIEKF